MTIQGLFLCPVETALKKLTSGVLAEYARIHGMSKKLKKWKLLLEVIHAVMEDAEEKQFDGNCAIDRWLTDLRELAFDMEDLLDEFSVEAKIKEEKAEARSVRKVHSFLISCCSRMNPHALLSDHCMAKKIEELDSRLNEISETRNFLHLIKNSDTRASSSSGHAFRYVYGKPQFITSSLPEPVFFGRGDDMDELLVLLTRIDSGDGVGNNFKVIPIVGMGGAGKTALAKQLYHHPSVRDGFTLRGWACVSDRFDNISFTKSILESVAPLISCEGRSLDWLQIMLCEQLSGKKFLIVLDDVWIENCSDLSYLLQPFDSGNHGSRILLTTRSLKVAKYVGDPKKLNLLSSDDCLSIILHYSLRNESLCYQVHLEDDAVKLAGKCKGLPLAANTIGEILHYESSDKKLREVLEHSIWDRDRENVILSALKLSYVHLPTHLKRCFVACALFPKEYVFDEDEVIHLWIVQGLLQKGNEKTYREVGLDYFHQLEARSLFQQVGEEKHQFSMHDFVNDLAKSIDGGMYFWSDEYKGSMVEDSLVKARHASLVFSGRERLIKSSMDVFRSMKKLRTLIPFKVSPYKGPSITVSDKVIHDLLLDLKYLRVLSLRYFLITKVPECIGELRLLLSLDLSYTRVMLLPDTVCDLKNLQSLLLRHCKRLVALPQRIHKLKLLLHLDICGTDNLKEMPPRIGDLRNLEILSKFVVKKSGQGLKELGQLKVLQRELLICNMQEAEDISDARITKLDEKDGLLEVSMEWSSNGGIAQDQDGRQSEVLDSLRPPREVQVLTMTAFGGNHLPFWLDNSCIKNLVSVTVKDCKYIESLSAFGQLQLLQTLRFDGLDAVSIIGTEFYGNRDSFKSLRALTFKNMVAWEKWFSYEGYEEANLFPCLDKLVIVCCQKLMMELPRRLDLLSKLSIRACPLLRTSRATLNLPSLNKISFKDSSGGLLTRLAEISSLTKMNIKHVDKIVNFDRRITTFWVALEEIRIKHCLELRNLWSDGVWDSLASLKRLIIQGCPELLSLVDGKDRRLPRNLKCLEILDCRKFENLPDDMRCLVSLRKICIRYSPKLRSFPTERLPPTLSSLTLAGLQFSPSQFHDIRLPSYIRTLHIQNCEGFESLGDLITDGQRFRSLQEMHIFSCNNLKGLPDHLQDLPKLSRLYISRSPSLKLKCFHPLPCSLLSFELHYCPKVESLPVNMHGLRSLRELKVSCCDGIICLPARGLPPNLESLEIRNCEKLKQPLAEWGLHDLTALHNLHIGGGMQCVDGIVTFPSADPDSWSHHFPPSLSEICISRMNSMERLADGLGHELTTLQMLHIMYCPKVTSLPGDGLPSSLKVFCLDGCPLLSERCSQPNGEYWPFLELVPDVLLW